VWTFSWEFKPAQLLLPACSSRFLPVSAGTTCCEQFQLSRSAMEQVSCLLFERRASVNHAHGTDLLFTPCTRLVGDAVGGRSSSTLGCRDGGMGIVLGDVRRVCICWVGNSLRWGRPVGTALESFEYYCSLQDTPPSLPVSTSHVSLHAGSS